MFDREVIDISGNNSTMSSDLDNSLFKMNQLILYTDSRVEEMGTIVGIHTEGKGAQPLYTINLNRGREIRVDAISLSLPTEGAPAEASRQQIEAAALVKIAMEVMKFAEAPMVAAAAVKLAIDTAAKQKHEIESTQK